MNWQSIYNSKVRTVEEVLSDIKSNDVITTSVVPMTPRVFLENLHKVHEDVNNVEVYTILNTTNYEFQSLKEYEGRFLNNSWFYGPPDRKVASQGLKTITYVPNNAHHAIIDLVQSGKKINYFVGTASSMDEHGYLSLSCSAFIEKDLIEAAEKVILEVNPNAPRTFGETEIHISKVDYIIETNHQLPEEVLIEPTEIEEKIGGFIADLIEDGSTIQMGIGGVPYAVSKFIDNKKDLGVHTEMFTEGMLELFNKGVITNERKTLWPGKFVCAFAFGTRKLYDFINNNPAVMVMRGSYTNNPDVIAQNNKMVSINTAIMVDLTGQVVSEAIGTRHYSGTGGQLDTHRGAVKCARLGKGGRGIIALRSTGGNNMSSIVPVLPTGSPITVPRQDIDCIVTEYGVANLRGRTVRERVKALINVAHPDHRDYLQREAEKLLLI
ncbi:acetyl-CoA hydrolase/transferase family protein [Anaerobranca gottschalkii]|uniref:Acyl-CoA hydrolase n=1 Tax=Anaerobranca gottschalkii DSM 13577 TaxID=1120990 RepID=A0A1I0A134_9FIRM|nr:acetyl-CoA hydrolase/transferase C-terminal domain-containing protein [Anaerobranca gottschalkii]SES87383.1 Acyl-CoA hydrolase [Anaerobranca gottschalkii DSM 13577]